MSERSTPSRKQLDAAMEKVRTRFGKRPNVTGIDVGYRYVQGARTPELCVRVHVQQKLPLSSIAESEVFPNEIDGIPLDVIEGRYRVARTTTHADHQQWFSHLMGGISCSRQGVSAGTLGAVVIDNRTGERCILSNWHVLAGASAQVGNPIIQPGGLDGGQPGSDNIAELTRWILEPAGDAAIARLTGRRPWLPVQYGTYEAFSGKVRPSKLGEVLTKAGRTTAVTRGRVDGEGIYRILYEVRPGVEEPRDIRGFKLVSVEDGNPDDEELSAGGDSGSIWYHATSRDAVGLHFAGEVNPHPSAEHAIACDMGAVLDRLEARIATFQDLLEMNAGAQSAGLSEENVGKELTPQPDWPYPEWPYPDLPWPQPPSGGWPWPRPYPGPLPGPWPQPYPWPIDPRTIRDSRQPRVFDDDIAARVGRANAGFGVARAQDAIAAASPTYDELANAVYNAIAENAYPGTFGTIWSKTPLTIPNHGGRWDLWASHYRLNIEGYLAPRYAMWTSRFGDNTLKALGQKRYDEIYNIVLGSMAGAYGVSAD